MSLGFYALDSNPQDTVTILMSSAPSGAAVSSTTMNSTTRVASAQVTWPIPTGTTSFYVQIFCVWAQDSHGLQSTQYCVNVLVDPVTTVPDVPEAPYLVKATGQSLKVAWASPNVTDTRTLNGFNLYMDGQQASATLETSLFKIGTAMEYTASFLRPVSQHSFTLTLCNRLGCSAQSAPGVFNTIGAPFNPPAVPELVTRDERSITVRWTPPYIPPDRTVTGFQLTRQPLNGPAIVVVLGADITEYKSEGLEPSSTHSFTVAACETLQCGRDSEPGVFDTLDGFSSLCESACPPKNKALRSKLLTHWGFDEGNGTYTASSVTGAPAAAFYGDVSWRSGEHGKAAQVSTSAYVKAQHGSGNNSLSVAREYTLCFWRRLHSGMIGGGWWLRPLDQGGLCEQCFDLTNSCCGELPWKGIYL